MKHILEQAFSFPIKNEDLFKTALTHRSVLNENKHIKEHNERLEFLGDAVLELIITEHLFFLFPDKEEGFLTAIRSSLVRGETLASLAEELPFFHLLKLSKGEDQLGGRTKSRILANTFEAIIGAIYIDSGIENAKKFIHTFLLPRLENIIQEKRFIDSKTLFQQYIQEKTKETPYYTEISASGPDHNKHFIVAVMVGKKEYGRGEGLSKQIAQQNAASQALEKLDIDLDALV
jgi:ribonuclease-3